MTMVGGLDNAGSYITVTLDNSSLQKACTMASKKMKGTVLTKLLKNIV